jgi:serine O-acetyltransferase
VSFHGFLKEKVTNFNYNKYWERRFALSNKKVNKLIKLYYQYYLKRIDAKNGADIAWRFDYDGKILSNNFAEPPILGHGIKGIVIAGGTKLGRNVFISHQVTIGRSRGGAPVIGNDVYIGPVQKYLVI